MTPQQKKRLATRLKQDEGVIPYAYMDHLGYWTIGVGRLIDKRKGGGLNQEEIDMLLANDISAAHDDLLDAFPWVIRLDEARFAVLVMMVFQLGIGSLAKFKMTMQSVEQGKYAEAARHMLSSKWAKQTPKRAKALADMMKTGVWN
jgi:lysozyme